MRAGRVRLRQRTLPGLVATDIQPDNQRSSQFEDQKSSGRGMRAREISRVPLTELTLARGFRELGRRAFQDPKVMCLRVNNGSVCKSRQILVRCVFSSIDF